ncbi:MAG: chromate transporter [Anaeroplasma sp.]|uniref:chromate transporter n=1 Tax=Anaeroplasma sp. TaxID=1872523 RepID=UPI002A90F961|nr:chromate transporter [Anaeroplasma sp.]MDY5982774.1 chromate transporter [Anaeroplasma sp.]
MELLQLFFIFFKLGIVNFGGGYALFPLLEREFVTKRKWVTNQELADYYAVGQCTPGAFAVNISTFLGIRRKGIIGGIVATLGFVFPAFIIIFVIASLLTNFSSNEYVRNALAGIRVCVFFLIIYAIMKLSKSAIKDLPAGLLAGAIAISAIAIDIIPLYVYVILAAIFGIVVSFIRERKKKNKNEEKEKIEVKNKVIKKDYKKPLKSIGIALGGFLVGISLGLVGCLSFIFIKNKKYREGLLSAILIWLIFIFGIIINISLGSTLVFDVFFQFFKIGFLAFGGGLATIPFLNELSLSTHWFSLTDLANMLAVSESTPGAMGINMSTYVGYSVFNKGFNHLGLSFLGSMVSTLGLVTPSVIVIFFVSLFLDKFKDNKYVNWIFYGLRAASIGLIFAAVYSVLKVSLFNQYLDSNENMVNAVSYSFHQAFSHVDGFIDFFRAIGQFIYLLFNFKAVLVGVLFALAIFGFKKHPILYIAFAAVVGICFQMYAPIYI